MADHASIYKDGSRGLSFPYDKSYKYWYWLLLGYSLVAKISPIMKN